MINTELQNEFTLKEYLKNIYLNYFFTKSISVLISLLKKGDLQRGHLFKLY